MSKDIEIKAKINAKGVEDGLNKVGSAVKGVGKEAAEAQRSTDKLAQSMSKLGSAANASMSGLAGAVFQGKLMADMAEQIGAKIGEAILAMVSLGTQTEQVKARFGAMKNNLTSAAETYRIFNDVARNTKYDFGAVNEMGVQLLNLGYNAQQAAEMITIVSDAAAGLGKGQEGAQALMDSLNRMRSTGIFTIRDMKALQEQGLHVEEAFAKAFGADTQAIMEMVKADAIDGKDAFEILANYMQGSFANAMANSKQNIKDLWSDVTGNVQTAVGQMGSAIAEAFNKSEIVQDMIAITQDFVDLVNSDAQGAFSDLKEVAETALGIISGMLKTVWQGIKLVILVAGEMYQAFKRIGAAIANALDPILKPLGAIYKAVTGIIATLGREVSSGIDAGWSAKYGGPDYDPLDSYGATDAVKYKGNGNYRARTKGGSGGASGGSGGGSLASPMDEYNSQIKKLQSEFAFNEKIIKTQEDAFAKVAAAANQSALAGLDGEARKQKQLEITQEQLIKAQNIDDKATARKIENYQAQMKVYQAAIDAGIAPDGTAEKIAALAEQITQEEKLLKVRKEMTQMQLDANTEIANNENASTAKWLEQEVQLWQGYAMSVSSSIGEAVGSVLDGQQTMGQALAAMAKNLIKTAMTTLTQWLALVAILAAFNDPTPARHASIMMFGMGDKYTLGDNGGYTRKKAAGGYISGPGTGTSDTAGLFALSNGEYVLRSAVVSQLGTPFLDGLNAGKFTGFATGGLVAGRALADNDAGLKSAAGRSLVLNISAIDASGFGEFLDRGGLRSIKQALTDDDRMFGAVAGAW